MTASWLAIASKNKVINNFILIDTFDDAASESVPLIEHIVKRFHFMPMRVERSGIPPDASPELAVKSPNITAV